jgi:twitching motility protein PilJ
MTDSPRRQARGFRARLARLLGLPVDDGALPCRPVLEQLFRTFPGLLAFKDDAGVYVAANDAMAQHLGMGSAALLLGKTDASLPSRAAAKEAQARWALISTTVRSEEGTLLGTLMVGLDVGERQAAVQQAKALESERDLLRTILNKIPDQIYAKNEKHQFLVANSAVARKITGTPDPALVIGKTDHDFFPAEDADQYRADEAKLMASGRESVELEEQAVYQDRTHWNLTSKLVLRDRERKVMGLVGINRDITARKTMEAALAAERTLLHSLMDNIPDCIYFKNREGRFVRANRAQAALLGVSDPDHLVGRRLSDFLPGAASRAAESEEEAVLVSGRPVVGKLEQVGRVKASPLWMLSTKVPIRDVAGRPTGLVAISRDVSERRQAEEVLEASLASFLEFANRVAEGDLTLRASEGSDIVGRIGGAVNRMLESFAAILTDINTTVVHVSASADEILSASRHIAEGAEQQSREVRVISGSVEEMAASMNTVSRDAAAWAASARGTLGHVNLGDTSVQQTSEAMNRIFSAVGETADKMKLLANRVTEISSIMEMIDEIASQSALLSLNAAIQAAHAGEAGRGFSVVADEIRHLAERSTQATRDVATIIETIQAEAGEAVEATGVGSREVRQGRDLADRARDSLRQISKAVGETVELSGSITRASTEQAHVTRQLAETMETIAGISQASSSGAHQTAQTVQSLVRLSRQLEESLGRFRIDQAFLAGGTTSPVESR